MGEISVIFNSSEKVVFANMGEKSIDVKQVVVVVCL